jgi:hypothetical protein
MAIATSCGSAVRCAQTPLARLHRLPGSSLRPRMLLQACDAMHQWRCWRRTLYLTNADHRCFSMLTLMAQWLRDGPVHISVDGTLRNRYVLAALLLIATVSASWMYWTVRRVLQGRWPPISLVVVTSLVLFASADGTVVHGVAVLLHQLGTGRSPSLTFFGAPARWLIAACSLLSAALALTLHRAKENCSS